MSWPSPDSISLVFSNIAPHIFIHPHLFLDLHFGFLSLKSQYLEAETLWKANKFYPRTLTLKSWRDYHLQSSILTDSSTWKGYYRQRKEMLRDNRQEDKCWVKSLSYQACVYVLFNLVKTILATLAFDTLSFVSQYPRLNTNNKCYNNKYYTLCSYLKLTGCSGYSKSGKNRLFHTYYQMWSVNQDKKYQIRPRVIAQSRNALITSLVIYIFNQETKTSGFLWAPGQPRIHKETLSPNKTKKQKKLLNMHKSLVLISVTTNKKR